MYHNFAYFYLNCRKAPVHTHKLIFTKKYKGKSSILVTLEVNFIAHAS